ncbi:DUF2335 domain-containing protein [Xenorhabdus szentirmaii]|uniref:DUF2335 domain-containing protein n=1 Tax=Xenorhabdus szentirmaii TaxID=290112 RepID=UPI002B4175B1|nr:DUF2335 domain-containing protein [Xenorhabdus sp. 5]
MDSEHQEDEETRQDKTTALIEQALASDPVVLERVLDNPKFTAVIQRKISTFQGPFPPPKLLKEYENTLPGAAERVFALTEKEQNHRHEIDDKVVNGGISKDKRGQWMGFGLALLILCGAFYFANKGEIGFASLLVTLDLVGLVAVFVLGRYLKPRSDDSDD